MRATFFDLVFGAHLLAAFRVKTASATPTLGTASGVAALAVGSLDSVSMLLFVLVEPCWGPGPVGL